MKTSRRHPCGAEATESQADTSHRQQSSRVDGGVVVRGSKGSAVAIQGCVGRAGTVAFAADHPQVKRDAVPATACSRAPTGRALIPLHHLHTFHSATGPDGVDCASPLGEIACRFQITVRRAAARGEARVGCACPYDPPSFPGGCCGAGGWSRASLHHTTPPPILHS